MLPFTWQFCLYFSHINEGPEYQAEVPQFCGKCYLGSSLWLLTGCSVTWLLSRFEFSGSSRKGIQLKTMLFGQHCCVNCQ